MVYLIAGVTLWTIVHLLPSMAPSIRRNLVAKIGAGAFKGLFALDILLALFLIIYGWKTANPSALYAPPLYGSVIPTFLMAAALLLFVASSAPSNIKRFVRHPQMIAVILWSAAHLSANGDSKSVTLFGVLGIWAVLEILFINKRDAVWVKPDAVPATWDILTVVIATVTFLALGYFHASLFGVASFSI